MKEGKLMEEDRVMKTERIILCHITKVSGLSKPPTREIRVRQTYLNNFQSKKSKKRIIDETESEDLYSPEEEKKIQVLKP